jgi:acetyltransferase-like isoleucine patch superfamily enzyme
MIFKLPGKICQYLYNLFIFNVKKVEHGRGWKINGRLYILNEGRIIIGENFLANSSKNANPIGGDTILRFVVRAKGELRIGNYVGISNSTIVCWNKIEIGDYVFIGGSCKIWDTDFHSVDPLERRHRGNANVITLPIKINDHAFIGGNSIILKGVEIGKNSVVAAGSVVTKSIPANEIWGGNPARFIRELSPLP